jgi:biopolymer transport protein ExbB
LILGFPPAAAAQDPAAAGAERLAAAEESLDIFSLLWKGGWVMIPIALASVLALTLIIERFISLRRVKVIPPGFLEGLKSLWGQGAVNTESGKDYCRQNPCVLGHLVEAGIPRIERGESGLQNALEDAGAREVDRMKRSLKPLSMIATVAPLLGLLGTVYGMISAFQAATNAGVGKSDVLAQGIYEALVTTAAGLTLAIPVLIIYQVLNNRIDSLVDDLDDSAEEFMAIALGSENA